MTRGARCTRTPMCNRLRRSRTDALASHLLPRAAAQRRRPRRRRHVDAVAAAATRHAAQGRRLQGRSGANWPTSPRAPMNAVVKVGGGTGALRVEGRPGADQPPLSRSASIQYNSKPGARPHPRRLRRRRPRRRTPGQPGLPRAGDDRLRPGHRPHPRRRARQDRARVLRRGRRRAARPPSPSAKREAGHALQRRRTCTTAPTST